MKKKNYNNRSKLETHLKEEQCERKLSYMLMITLNGIIQRSGKKLGVVLERCTHGESVGLKPRSWKICHAQELLGVFPPEVRAQATALACSIPKKVGIALSRWSLSEIANRLITLGVVEQVARSTICRWFAGEKLKPWRYHSWQHIVDPQAFLERARPILRLYGKAKSLLTQGVWVVCVDEKTSIQARKRPHEPEPAIPGHPLHISSRYKREGALHLFGGLSVADGQKYGQTRLRKRFVDFQAFLLQIVIPEALRRGVHTLNLILDNGPTHAPKQLERWLEKQIAVNNWPLQIEVFWLPTRASWLNQIEIWFSVLQRKLLQPNYFADLRSLVAAVDSFIRHDNRSAKPLAWTYTTDKLELKLGMNL